MREQEVRKILVETNLTRTVLIFESQQSNETTQARDRRQSVSSQTATKLRTDDSALIQENIRKIDQLRTEITLLELRTSQSQVTPGSWIIRRFDKTWDRPKLNLCFQLLCWCGSNVTTQRTTSTKCLWSTRRDFQPTVILKKEEKTINIFFRRSLDRPGQTSPTNQWTVLLADDHHDWLRWKGVCGCVWTVRGKLKTRSSKMNVAPMCWTGLCSAFFCRLTQRL